MIPFSPPYISKKAIQAVVNVLQSGWITTGPVTKEFENKITAYCGNQKTLCVNSATAGLELMLRWFGVGPGDEVIVPAYTYCATANVVAHCGAKPVMVDSGADNVNITHESIRRAVTAKTKVIMPVDVFGIPCSYDEINSLVREPEIMKQFHPSNPVQEKLGRILVLSDAAHSLGATYHGKRTGNLTDVSVFSFHAVKNLTTAEGGAIALNLPAPFNNEDIYAQLNILGLHGQSKDAYSKTEKKSWRYDVAMAGYKMNMTDIQAALGIAQLEEYDDILRKRKYNFDAYTNAFRKYDWAVLPVYETGQFLSSFQVYDLRIKGITEKTRDKIIDAIMEKEVSVNVHFQPLPMLSYYKNLGYQVKDYPNAYKHYAAEISLPVFYSMTDEQLQEVIEVVTDAVQNNL
mgnify:CR=1 FL=1